MIFLLFNSVYCIITAPITNVIKGMLKFANTGCICEVEPRAFSRLETKYKKNIIISEFIITFENLSFCFIPCTSENARNTRLEI